MCARCVCYKFCSFDCWDKTTQANDDDIEENFQREKEKPNLKIVARPINYPNSNRIIYLRSELNVSRSVGPWVFIVAVLCVSLYVNAKHTCTYDELNGDIQV